MPKDGLCYWNWIRQPTAVTLCSPVCYVLVQIRLWNGITGNSETCFTPAMGTDPVAQESNITRVLAECRIDNCIQ